MPMLLPLHAALLALSPGAYVAPRGAIRSTYVRHAPALLSEGQRAPDGPPAAASKAQVDVTPAARQIRDAEARPPSEHEMYLARVGKGINADPAPLADGSIPLRFNFDVRWFLFLSIFSLGEDTLLAYTEPLRELSVGGYHPFDAIISTLAGPVVRSSDPASDPNSLHEVPTGGLAVLALYFVYWKGWAQEAGRNMQGMVRRMRERS